MPLPFSLHDFIVNSNRIDKQFDKSPEWSETYQRYIQGGKLIPGETPGDPMYDRQKEAFEYAESMSREIQTPPRIHLDLHRILTKNIEWFETRGMSGRYRTTDNLWIGGQQAPPAREIRVFLEETLLPKMEFLRDKHREKPWSKAKAEDQSWWCHHYYECVHPMLDGNGRTGRLLLNYMRISLGMEPKVVWHVHKQDYYRRIQTFRDFIFNPSKSTK